MLLSVIVPVFNEAGNIFPLIEELATLVARYPTKTVEIIYVDDGSTDSTWPELIAAQRNYEWLRLLQHDHSAGQSAAVYTGANHAQGDWLAVIDGDGQNDPLDIYQLLKQLQSAHQQDPLVTGIIGHRQHRVDSKIKILSSRIANRVRALLLHDDNPDNGCGIKIVWRKTFLQLPYFNHMHRFMPSLIKRCGQRMLYYPVHHRPRVLGQSKYGTWDRLWVGLIDMLGVMWLNARARNVVVKEQRHGD